MSTSFTKAALGAEGVGKDIDLFIGNGFAHGHAEHTLAMMREMPAVRALFESGTGSRSGRQLRGRRGWAR